MTPTGPDGTVRCAVVVADSAAAAAAPPGVDGRRFALAMVEDVLELVADLAHVTSAVVAVPRGDAGWRHDVEQLCWPGTAVGEAEATAGAALLAGFELAAAQGADAVAVVAGDAPDLPGLLLGKAFRAVGSADVAVSPAAGGGLVAVAARLPAAPWWRELGVGFDDLPMQPDHLRRRVPPGVVVAESPGWHRLRAPVDVRRLDPGLEGWDVTRALLTAGAPRGLPPTSGGDP